MSQTCQEAALEFRMLSGFMAKLGRQDFEQRMQREGYDITGLQFGIMRMLAMDGDHSLKELSSKFMLDPSTLVPTVDALERKGIVTRHRDPDDRRRVVIGLTDEGHSIGKRFHHVANDDIIYQSMLAMGDADVEHLMTLLRKLVQGMPEGNSVIDSVCKHMKASQIQP